MANEVKFKLSVDGDKAVLSSFDRVRSGMSGVTSAATTMGSAMQALGVALSVGAVVAWAKSTIDAADAVNDLSQQVGIAVKDLAKYELAASQSGTTMQALAKGIKGLGGNLIEHGAALKKAGIDATTADAAMLQLADVFAAMPDGIEKTALATKMFGKSGMEMIPMLNLGSQGLQTAAEKSAAYAAQMTAMAPLADAFNDNLAELGLHSKVSAMSILNDMLPALVQITGAMAIASQESGVLKAAWTGLGGVWSEGWGKQFEIWRLKANAGLEELEAKKKRFFGQDKEADALMNSANERYLQIQKLLKGAPAPKPAAPDVPKLDTAKWMAEYKAMMAALRGGDDDSAAKSALKARQKATEDAAKADIAAFKVMDDLRTKAAGDEMKRAEDQAEALAKAREEALKQSAAYYDTLAKGLTAQQESNDKLREQNEEIGLTTEALGALRLARFDAAIAQEQEIMTMASAHEASAGELLMMQKRIDKLKEERALRGQGAAATIAADAAKDMAEANKNAAAESERFWTDALMRAFDAGKGFFKTMWSSITNWAKTMVLKVFVQPVAGAISGMVGTMGTAAAGGVAGTAGTGLMGSIGSSAAWASMSAGMSQFGTAALASTQSLLGFSGATATAAQASTAAANGLAMGATGSGSMMATLGKAVPYIAAAIAVAAAIGLFRKTKTVGAGISGTFGEDSSLESYTAKRKSGYLFGGPKYWDEKSPLDEATTRTLGNAFNAVKESAKSAATALGLSADSVTSYSKTFRLALTGDAAKDQAATEALFTGMSEDMARALLGSYRDVVTTVREGIAEQHYEGGSTGGGFTDRQVTTSTYTASEFAKEGETASQTLQRLSTSITLVNGAFGTLGYDLLAVGLSGASTASKLIDAFGGLEAFASTTASYYANFYPDAERTARLTEVTSAAFDKLGITMPKMDESARKWYRSEVERLQAMDMGVEANRTQLASIMALGGAVNLLAPTFDDVANAATNAASAAAAFAASLTSAQDDAYGALLDANRAVYGAQQEAAQAQQQAAQATTEAANAIRDAMAGAGQSIVDFVKSLRASIASPANLAASYKTDLLLAQGGDLEASKRIPASGKAYLDAQIANASTMVDVQRATARMASELAALPAVKTYEDKLLEAVNGVTSAVGGTTSAVVDLHGNFMAGLTLNARSEIVKILEFIVDDTKMTPETKALALLASGSVSRVVALSATSLLRPQDQELALMTGGTIIKTIGTALGANDPLALSIAFAQSSTVEKVIKASGGLLSPDQATLLNAIGVYNKTVNIDVVVSSASLTAFQQLLMTTFGTVDISAIGNTNGTGGINLAGLVGQGALDRLDSISTYIQSLSWGASAGQDNANLWTVYDIAKKFGVTQVDLANAAGIYNPGMTYGNLVAGMDAAGIPRFAAGTNYLPSDMLAQVHEGERIVPKADNLLLMQRLQSPQANNEALVAEIRALNEKMGRLNDEVRALRASSERGNVHTQIAADRLSGRQGVPFLVELAPGAVVKVAP